MAQNFMNRCKDVVSEARRVLPYPRCGAGTPLWCVALGPTVVMA